MTISELKQLEAVDGWVDFSGQIVEVKETKTRTKKNVLMQKVKLNDSTGEIGVWLYADKQQQYLPNQIIVANGMLKEYEGRRYMDYATVKSVQAQQAPQNAPQASSQAAGATNDSDMVRIRSMAISYAKDLYCEGVIQTNEDFYEEAECLTAFIVTGRWLDKETDKPQVPASRDDIPF